MAFVKTYKSKAYFKRFQTKYKRRREGKTDYKARRAMTRQSKNKYNAPKYRLVARFSNKKVMCQIVYAELVGDKVLCAADSTELKRYGAKVGLKNYAAAYATGLLIARRVLTQLGLAELYEGQTDVDGEMVTAEMNKRTYFVDEVDEDKRPFRASLDVGIRGTTTGNRLFGVVKGAADGGIDIPHSEKRFPGYDREANDKKGAYDAGVHAERIFGEHVANYMEELDEEEVAKLFSDYAKGGLNEEGKVREMWESVHAAVRANPARVKAAPFKIDKKWKRMPKQSYDDRKAGEAVRKAAIEEAARAAKEAAANASSSEEEEESEEESD
jgi:large subunit ribosomal protein L5e